MDSINEINIKISFGSSGKNPQITGGLRSEGESPPPPEVGGSAFEPPYKGVNPSPPPPPGYFSADKQIPGGYSRGEEAPPPPIGSFDKQSTGFNNIDPPKLSENIGKEAADPDSLPMPPGEGGSKPIEKKDKSSRKNEF